MADVEFIELEGFTKRLAALAKEYAEEVLLAIQNDLLKNPKRGDVVPGLLGARKGRIADPIRRKGKRGGFRYLYYYIEKDGQIFLLWIFGKNEQDDLSPQQRTVLCENLRYLKGAKV